MGKDIGSGERVQGKDTGEKAKDLGSRAKETLNEGVSTLTKSTRTPGRQPGARPATWLRRFDVAQDTWEQTREFIKKHPVACVGAGIGIGFLLGLALPGPVEMTRRMSRIRRRATWARRKWGKPNRLAPTFVVGRSRWFRDASENVLIIDDLLSFRGLFRSEHGGGHVRIGLDAQRLGVVDAVHARYHAIGSRIGGWACALLLRWPGRSRALGLGIRCRTHPQVPDDLVQARRRPWLAARGPSCRRSRRPSG